MNTLQLYRCKELFEKYAVEKGISISIFLNGKYVSPYTQIIWLGFKDGFEIALADVPLLLYPHQIIELANRATVDLGRESPNPYERNSAEYRYWQDGCRMGIDAIEEREENAD